MDDPFPNFDSLHRLMEVQRPTRHANFLDLVNQKLLEPPKRKSVLAPYFAAVLEFQKPYHTPSPSPSPSPEPLSRPVSANPKPRQAKRTSDEAFMPASNGSGPGRKKARISGRREIRNSRLVRTPESEDNSQHAPRPARAQLTSPARLRRGSDESTKPFLGERTRHKKLRLRHAPTERHLRQDGFIKGGHFLRPRTNLTHTTRRRRHFGD